MNRDQAFEIVRIYTRKEQLIHHMLSVEAVMRFYAAIFNENKDFWGICGLLHDFDYEIHPHLDQHPQAGAEILRKLQIPEEIILTILSHADHTGVSRDTPVRKALYACDEITGLVTACTLVRPSKSILEMEAKSVKKKWGNRHFAAGANRDEIARAAREFGVDLWEHVDNVIKAMRTIARDIALDGSLLNQ